MDANAVRMALQSRNALMPCPACGNSHWIIVDEQTEGKPVLGLLKPNHGMTLASSNIPTVAVACSNCGFLRLHAERILGQPAKFI